MFDEFDVTAALGHECRCDPKNVKITERYQHDSGYRIAVVFNGRSGTPNVLAANLPLFTCIEFGEAAVCIAKPLQGATAVRPKFDTWRVARPAN